jgi:hemerythrin
MLTETNEFKESNPWNDTFPLFDIDVIDNHNKKLFELYYLLIGLNANNYDFESISKIIDELSDYTQYHFETEEDLMIKSNIQDTEMHLQHHTLFRNKVNEFRTMCTYRNQVLLDLMIEFLRKWFLLHIYIVDQQSAEAIRRYLASTAAPIVDRKN